MTDQLKSLFERTKMVYVHYEIPMATKLVGIPKANEKKTGI